MRHGCQNGDVAVSRNRPYFCCCGTGGFLVSWLNNLYDILLVQEESLLAGCRFSPKEQAYKHGRDACNWSLFGLDINPFLVRTCQMNFVSHGDGSSNVFRADTVRSPGEWDDEARRRVPYGKADMVLANPPFGGYVKIEVALKLGPISLAVTLGLDYQIAS